MKNASSDAFVRAWHRLDVEIADLRSMSFVVDTVGDSCLRYDGDTVGLLVRAGVEAFDGYRVLLLTDEQFEGMSFAVDRLGSMARDLDKLFRELSKEVMPRCA